MSLTNTTHVNFVGGRARAALEFWQSVFGGQLMAFSYSDAHNVQRDEEADWLMWGGVSADNGFAIMAYDVPASRTHDAGDDPFYESVRAQTVEEAQAVFDKLAVGGNVKAPFGPAAWAPAYGMVTDKFGITWVVDVEAPQQAS